MNTPAAQRVLITGAGSGLGRALARHFAAKGWRVAVTDQDQNSASETLASLDPAAPAGFADTLDVTRDADFSRIRQRIEQEFDGLDVLVNNAGIGAAGTVAGTSIERWQQVIDIDLVGVVRGCKTFLPLLTQSPRGHIVNVASFAAFGAAPGMASYNVAKAGVMMLSESLRAELAETNVGVSVACPSFFQTNILESMPEASDQLRGFVDRLMARSSHTADDVADDICNAIEENRFLVISHKEARRLHLLKRLFPEYYFRRLVSSTRSFVTGQ